MLVGEKTFIEGRAACSNVATRALISILGRTIPPPWLCAGDLPD
jgi:hypothetical protein